MAAQTPVVQASVGSPLQRIVVYAIYGATTNDTVQCSTEFKKVATAVWFPATGTSVVTTGLTIGTNTNVTLTPANITVDDGYLICIGASAQQ